MILIKRIGLILLIAGISLFTAGLFVPQYMATEQSIKEALDEKSYEVMGPALLDRLADKEFSSAFQFSNEIRGVYTAINEENKAAQQWDLVIWDSSHDFAGRIASASAGGFIHDNNGWALFLTFGLAILGGLMYVLPNVILLGPAGIKNNHIFHHKATNRGWIGWLIFGWLVSFYILLYFFPDYTIGWAQIASPASEWIKGRPGDRWFLYGLMYCSVMTVMAIRMYVKYRNNKYQIVRTTSIWFFQIAFAFLIPELMYRFNLPGMDFKNIWPLDYDFFFGWNLDTMMNNGTLGLFMLVWGIALILVAVPVFVYFFGKRWYCSWVCGCGGLAETLGDPYRQLSDKSVKSWKIERYLIHGVLVFAIIMTALTLYTFFSGVS